MRELIERKCGDAYRHPQFQADVIRPLNIDDLLDQPVKTLSGVFVAHVFFTSTYANYVSEFLNEIWLGGELQRIAIILCLGQPAEVYLLDEPSAYVQQFRMFNESKS